MYDDTLCYMYLMIFGQEQNIRRIFYYHEQNFEMILMAELLCLTQVILANRLNFETATKFLKQKE